MTLNLDWEFTDRGISSIVGSVLVLSIIVILALTIGYFVYSVSIPDTNSPTISVTDGSDGAVIINTADMGTAKRIELNYNSCNIRNPDGTVNKGVSPCKITTSESTIILTPTQISSGPETILIFGDHGDKRELVREHTPSESSLTSNSSQFVINSAITNSSPSSPITAGSTLTFDAVIQNTGDEADVQDVTVTVENVNDGSILGTASKRVSLDSGASKTYSRSNGNAFTIATSGGDAGTYEATIRTDDTSTTLDVEILGAGSPTQSWCVNNFLNQSAGTTSDRHNITTARELQCMAAAPGEHYKLGTNIDAAATGTSDWRGGNGFDPVGHPDNYLTASGGPAFTGSLVGQEYDITGLTINRGATTRVGLIGQASAGSISNVALSGSNITGGNKTGGVVGDFSSGVTISDVTSGGTVSGGYYVGGVVGRGEGATSSIVASTSSATVTGESYVGGFAGYVVNSVDLNGTTSEMNSATGDVNATGYAVGGFAGMFTDITLTNGSASGQITGRSHVGGLVGSIEGDTHIVNGSASGGDVINTQDYTGSESATYGSDKTGGLVGNVAGGEALIDNSSASNAVQSNYSQTGGLVGYLGGASHIDNSSATGIVSGGEYTGGLVGYLSAQHSGTTYTIRDSYATGDVTGNNKVGGLVGIASSVSDAFINDTYATGAISGSSHVGGLLGNLAGDSTVNNSHSEATTVNGTTNTGGLVGSVTSNAQVMNSSSDNTVTGESNTGGLVGYIGTSAVVTNGTSRSTVQVAAGVSGAWANTGGLVGKMDGSSQITSSAATGDVIGSHNTGGLVGYAESSNDISDSTADAGQLIEGERRVGGLVGSASGTSISNSHTRNVEVSGTQAAGGLVGYMDSSVTNSYAEGVTVHQTSDYVGGLVGWVNAGVLSDVYVTGATVNGTDSVGGLVGNLGDVGGGDDGGGTVTDSGSGYDTRVSNSTVTAQDLYAGGIAGQFDDSSLISGSTVETTNVDGVGLVGGVAGGHNSDMVFINDSTVGSSVTVGSARSDSGIGGLIGVHTDGEISNSSAYATVEGTTGIGGLVGAAGQASTTPHKVPTITNTQVGSVSGSSTVTGSGEDVGGLVGFVEVAYINESEAHIDVSTDDRHAGGLVGHVGFAKENQIVNSHATGDVSADTNGYAGGLVGRIATQHDDSGGADGNGTKTIRNSYAEGTVSGSRKVGGLIGSVVPSSNLRIANTHAVGNVTSTGGYVGGLIGNFAGESDLENSYATGNTVRGDSGDLEGVGGLAGVATTNTTISGSHSTNTVKGDRNTGGLVGFAAFDAVIDSSYSTSDVSLISGASYTWANTGGLIGKVTDRVQVTESYATSGVSGNNNVGGLVGFADGGTIRDTYAQGSVSGDQRIGGLVGSTAGVQDVARGYATGSVSGSSDVGGILGFASNSDSGTTDTYWDTATTGTSDGIGNQGSSFGDTTGLTTSEMQGSSASSNMDGFDFSSTWTTQSSDYPALSWE